MMADAIVELRNGGKKRNEPPEWSVERSVEMTLPPSSADISQRRV